MRGEKRSYIEYQTATTKLEHLTRTVKGYEWTLAVDKVKKAEEVLKRKKKDIEEQREEVDRGGRELGGMEKELGEINKRRDKVRDPPSRANRLDQRRIAPKTVHADPYKELAKGGKVQALTEAVNNLDRELVKTKTQLEIKEGMVKDDLKRIEAAKKAMKEVRSCSLVY